MKRSVVHYSDTKIKNRLSAWYDAATDAEKKDGLHWYDDAQNFCFAMAEKYSIDAYKVATVVSCLSPNNKWGRNKIDAEAVIIAHQNGMSPDSVKVCTYNANKLKAFKALDGMLIAESAPKTHAFAMNVGELSSDHITIDKWHLRACVTKPSEGKQDCPESCTAKQYRRIERITAEIAKEKGIKSYQLQAVIWVAIRNNWK